MIRKILSVIAILAMILGIPTFPRAAGNADTVTSATQPRADAAPQTGTGVSAFSADYPYTLEEMLTYAIQDEYAAHALYGSTVNIRGSGEPFGRLLQEENDLIVLLTLLLTDHGVALPDPPAVQGNQAMASLREICLAGIQAERISLDMYRAFLAKDNVPNSVHDVFQLLFNISQSHLDALTAKAGVEDWLQVIQYQDDHDDDDEDEDDDDDNEDGDD